MKTIALSLLLVLSALTARAGNEGPQAAPQAPQPTIIAQVVTGSGFAPPEAPMSSSVDVLSDGQVRSTINYRAGRTVVAPLATLSAEALAKVKALVQTTKPGALVDPDPKHFGCEDAPSTTYYAVLNDGTKIAVAARENCKDFARADESSNDYQLKGILSGLSALADLF